MLVNIGLTREHYAVKAIDEKGAGKDAKAVSPEASGISARVAYRPATRAHLPADTGGATMGRAGIFFLARAAPPPQQGLCQRPLGVT